MSLAEEFNELLDGTGFNVISLHLVWMRASRGIRGDIFQLDRLTARHPKVWRVIDYFNGSYDPHRKLIGIPNERSQWSRLRLGGASVPGGLPSLGRRR